METLHGQLISSINDRTRDISLKSLEFSGLFKLDAKYNLEGLTLAIELKTWHVVSNLLRNKKNRCRETHEFE